MSLSPQQLETRAPRVAATEIGAIMGEHPWRSPMSVYLEKIGEAPAFVETNRSKWGQLLEPLIVQDFSERTGLSVARADTMVHETRDWLCATPDGICYPRGAAHPIAGLEIKTHSRDIIWRGGLEYGDPDTDQVPAHEMLQCMQGMAVTGLRQWFLVSFVDGLPMQYIIRRDEELIEAMSLAASEFMARVAARTPPEPDGHKAWSEYLRARWKTSSAFMITPDAQTLELINTLREERAAIIRHERREAAIEQALKVLIGENGGIEWREPGNDKPSKITWKFNQPSKRTDYAAAVQQMRNTAQLALATVEDWKHGDDRAKVLAGIVGLVDALTDIAGENAIITNTETAPGARPFNVPRSWAKGIEK